MARNHARERTTENINHAEYGETVPETIRATEGVYGASGADAVFGDPRTGHNIEYLVQESFVDCTDGVVKKKYISEDEEYTFQELGSVYKVDFEVEEMLLIEGGNPNNTGSESPSSSVEADQSESDMTGTENSPPSENGLLSEMKGNKSLSADNLLPENDSIALFFKSMELLFRTYPENLQLLLRDHIFMLMGEAETENKKLHEQF